MLFITDLLKVESLRFSISVTIALAFGEPSEDLPSGKLPSFRQERPLEFHQLLPAVR